jgi:uncharacterized membrane protein YfcA
MLGALAGVGGGILLVPSLVLIFHLDMHVAVATSLVAVVATSTSAGSVYVGEGLSNMRLGMSLEVATTLGGITGGLLAIHMNPSVLGGTFCVLMAVTTVLMLRGKDASGKKGASGGRGATRNHGWEETGRLAGAYYDVHLGHVVHYQVSRIPLGSAISFLAGAISGLLGIGGGFMKVPAMSLGMRVPIKVAAATSNMMIGVTAIASLFVYFARGFVHPAVAVPVVVGIVIGALVGARLAPRVPAKIVRYLLAAVLAFVTIQMGIHAWRGTLGH